MKSFEQASLHSRQDFLNLLSGNVGVAIRYGRSGASILPEKLLTFLNTGDAARYVFEKMTLDFEKFDDFPGLTVLVFPTVSVPLTDFETVSLPG
ncbi:MAG: hypothetical protein KGJ84_08405 [Elusimicrobia bacterium]|nr:hypothetical protein [Elusimicrobiota bacterium]